MGIIGKGMWSDAVNCLLRGVITFEFAQLSTKWIFFHHTIAMYSGVSSAALLIMLYNLVGVYTSDVVF